MVPNKHDKVEEDANYFFLSATFSLPSSSSLLKLPIIILKCVITLVFLLIFVAINFQFVRSRVGGSQISNKPFYKVTTPDDHTLLFESRFECGNLLRAIKV